MIDLTEEQRSAIRDLLPARIADDNRYLLLPTRADERLAEADYYCVAERKS
ncbi:MAG TPA: hypothetical protein VJ783_16115 [Pirellulales bacterium]|nr:hypothetical protein [Pirellulales bacterium]